MHFRARPRFRRNGRAKPWTWQAKPPLGPLNQALPHPVTGSLNEKDPPTLSAVHKQVLAPSRDEACKPGRTPVQERS